MPTPDPNDHEKRLTEDMIRDKAREMFGESAAAIDIGAGWRSVAGALAQFRGAAEDTGRFSDAEALELTHDLLHIIVNDVLEQARRNKES